MNFVSIALGSENPIFLPKKPTWDVPQILLTQVKMAGVGYKCYVEPDLDHELLGEPCGAILSDGSRTCVDLWTAEVASQWPSGLTSGGWLCGQGHAPAGNNSKACPDKRCPVTIENLPEVAATTWITAVSGEVEGMAPTLNLSVDTKVAAKTFAKIFGTPGSCGTHHVGYLINEQQNVLKCNSCEFQGILDCPDSVSESEMEVDTSNGAAENHDPSHAGDNGPVDIVAPGAAPNLDEAVVLAQVAAPQAALPDGRLAIWKGAINKTYKISFTDLVEFALREGMPLNYCGTHMRTYDTRDASWIYLYNKFKSENKLEEIKCLLPNSCLMASEERLFARFCHLADLSNDLLPGDMESTRNPLTLPYKAPQPVESCNKRKVASGHLEEPPSKKAKTYELTSAEFLQAMSSYMAAVSSSPESCVPEKLVENILDRISKRKKAEPRLVQSLRNVQLKVVENPNSDNSNNSNSESSNPPKDNSTPGQPLSAPSSSKETTNKSKKFPHKSIIEPRKVVPKPSYKDQSVRHTGSVNQSKSGFPCGFNYAPDRWCEFILQPWMRWCRACENRRNPKPYNAYRGGSRGGPSGGPRGGGRGAQGGGRGYGRGRGAVEKK